MGYYGQFEFDVVIDATQVLAAEQALAASERFGEEFTTDYNGKIDEFLNYYWLEFDVEFVEPSSPLTALAEAAEDLPIRDPRGDLVMDGYTNQKWRSYARAMFEILAPFIKPGSLIEIQGEEGEKVRWEFDGEELVADYAEVMFSDQLAPLQRAEACLEAIAKYLKQHEGFGDIRGFVESNRPDLLADENQAETVGA